MNKSLVAKRLVEIRKGETQEDVARAIGISLSAMAMYETGKRIPRDEIKVKLANHYNTTVEELFF